MDPHRSMVVVAVVGLLLFVPCHARGGVTQKQLTFEFDQNGTVWFLGSPLAFLGVDEARQDFLATTVLPNAGAYDTMEFVVSTARTGSVELPSDIGKMCKLGGVILNGLHGTIPTQIGALQRLAALWLQGSITTVPSQLGLVSALQGLYLERSSEVAHIPFPSELLQLRSLLGLVLTNARFEGTVPTAIAQLAGLQHLFLLEDCFEGSLPSELGLLSRLQVLTVWANPRMTARLPSELGQLAPELQLLRVPLCAFTGQLASQLGLLTGLEELDVADNSLSGTLASELGNLRRLHTLRAGQNLLSGQLPSELGLLGGCTSLSLGGNLFSGTVPRQVWLLGKLEDLGLDSNDLHGTLPSQVGLLVRATSLVMGDNPSLSGTLPSQLGLLGQLVELGLEGCRFHGAIPTQLGTLSRLEALTVARNLLGSSLPVQLAALTRLSSLDVGWNRLAGTIPPHLVTALSQLTSVVLEHNSFDGVLAVPDGPSEDSVRAVWLGNCTDSGLSRSECKLSCAPCRGWEWKVRDCKGREQAPLCMPVFAPPLAVLGAVVGVAWVVKRSGTPPNTRRKWAMFVVLCAYHLVNLLTDVLFAIDARGVVGTLAFVVLGVEFAGALLGATWIQHRSHSNQGAVVLGTVVVASVLYPSTLEHVPTPESLHKPVVFLLLSLSLWEALFQGLLQAYSALTGSTSVIVLLSLGLTAVTIMSKMAVFVILSLSRVGPDGTELQLALALFSLPSGEENPPKSRPAREKGGATWAQGSDVDEGVEGTVGEEGKAKERSDDGNAEASGPTQPDKQEHVSKEEAKPRANHWRGRAVMLLCCGATLVSVLSTACECSAPTSRVANEGAVGWSQQQEIAVRPEPTSAVQRVALGLPRKGSAPSLGKAECPESLVTFNGDVMEVFGIPVGLFSLTFVAADMREDPFLSSTDTIAFLYLISTRSLVPSEIGLATACATLSLDFFEGPIPSQIGLLQSLNQLFLRHWDAGALPSEFGLLTKLTHLESQECVSGPLPSQIGLVPLNRLALDGQPVHGLPSQLLAVSSLTSLDFAGASAWGDVLDFAHRNFASIDFSDNAFSGTIPTTLGLCSNLTDLNLATNSLSGTVPSQLGLPARLTRLDVSANQLHGTLPTQLGALSRLVALALADNQALRGSVPSELGRCTPLAVLSLGANALTGTVPSQLGLLSALTELGLESNGLSGALPSQLGGLVLLASLDVADNRLGGTLPLQLARLTALTHVAIGDNHFSGDWPVQGAMLALWTEHCEFSGLESGARCARECPSCGYLAIAVADCDRRGFGGTCAPWYVLVPATAPVFAAMWFLVKRSSGNKEALSRQRRAAVAAGSTFAVFVWIAVLTFMSATTGAVQILAIAALGFRVLTTSLVATAELAFNHRTAPGANLLSHTELVEAFLLCVVDPFVVLELSHARVRPRTVVAVLTTVLVSDLPMLALESVELHRRRQENELTTVTALALALTSVLAVSCARVFVLHLNQQK